MASATAVFPIGMLMIASGRSPDRRSRARSGSRWELAVDDLDDGSGIAAEGGDDAWRTLVRPVAGRGVKDDGDREPARGRMRRRPRKLEPLRRSSPFAVWSKTGYRHRADLLALPLHVVYYRLPGFAAGGRDCWPAERRPCPGGRRISGWRNGEPRLIHRCRDAGEKRPSSTASADPTRPAEPPICDRTMRRSRVTSGCDRR